MEQKRMTPRNHFILGDHHRREARVLNLRKIVQELKAERRKLDAAIVALERLAKKSSTRREAVRPRPTANPDGDASRTNRKLIAPAKGRLLLFPAVLRRRKKSGTAQDVRSEKETGA
jgi:hypothetical protein